MADYGKEANLAGRKRSRSRLKALKLASPTSWLHKCRPSIGDPDMRVYFLCTPHGLLTINQEYFCWIYAATNNASLASRMAYGRTRTSPITFAERGRVSDLLDMHTEGVLNLNIGPWKYYGFDVGDPSAVLKPEIKDYSDYVGYA